MEYWSDEDWSFFSEMFYQEFHEELCYGRTPRGYTMSALESGKTPKQVAEELEMPLDYVNELYELMLYEKSKQKKE